MGAAFSDLLSAFGSDTTSETVRQELAYVYTKLFLGPRGIVISPVESVYRQRKAGKPEMVIMTATALDVEGYYGRFGMAGMRGEPSDKIETELEFVSLLLHHHTEGNVGVTGEEPLVTLRGFYFDHLSQWVPDYCAELTEKSDNDFFRALSEALKALMWSLQHLLIEQGGSPSSATPAGRANRRARRHSRHGSKSDAKRTGGAPLATSLLNIFEVKK